MKVLSYRQFNDRLKATVQASGKLSFTEDAAKAMGIGEGSLIKFAIDDENDNQLYVVLSNGSEDPDAFRVRKAGVYCYVSARNIFDALGVDYRKQAIVFQLVRVQSLDESLGGMSFRMCKRKN